MPTTHPRHMITETPDLARALDVAAQHWPHAKGKRTELLRLIIDAGINALDEVDRTELERQRQAAREFSEAFNGTWPANWRELRDAEWPA